MRPSCAAGRWCLPATASRRSTSESRSAKQGTVWDIVRGGPGAGVLLPVVLSEGVNKGRLSLERAVEVTSTSAARIFGLHPRKGAIQVGADADLTIVDLGLAKTVTRETFGTWSDYTLYSGVTLTGWPVVTMVRGRIVSGTGSSWRRLVTAASCRGTPSDAQGNPRVPPPEGHIETLDCLYAEREREARMVSPLVHSRIFDRGRIARLERSIPRARRHERVRIALRTTIAGHRVARTPRGEP